MLILMLCWCLFFTTWLLICLYHWPYFSAFSCPCLQSLGCSNESVEWWKPHNIYTAPFFFIGKSLTDFLPPELLNKLNLSGWFSKMSIFPCDGFLNGLRLPAFQVSWNWSGSWPLNCAVLFKSMTQSHRESNIERE